MIIVALYTAAPYNQNTLIVQSIPDIYKADPVDPDDTGDLRDKYNTFDLSIQCVRT